MNGALYQEILFYMQKKNLSRTDLALHSEIPISDISRIFNHKQPLNMQKLDAITDALGLPEGHFYSFYVEECFNKNGHLDKRRSEQFLYKCVILGHKKHSDKIISAMLEEKSKTIRNKNLTYIFFIAEKLFKEGRETEALSLYEVFIDNEPNRFTEQVAISYFRQFYILKGAEKVQHALVHVLEYLAYLPFNIRTEATLWIMAVYYRREEWEEVLYYAKKLEQIADSDIRFGSALMYQSYALNRLDGSLKEILHLTDRYSVVNDYFYELAEGNRLYFLLENGQLEHVDDYLKWLEKRDDIYVGLPRVLEAYVNSNRLEDARRLLVRFQDVIEDLAISKEPWIKEKMYMDFKYAHALYLCKSKAFVEGLNELLDIATVANKIRNFERLKKCILVYWGYRQYATVEHEAKFIELLSTGK
ncbi:hypothetical protein [Sporosarcina sp. NPDC096371]|uniref:hypothetical protein n=1 Tax=Sporosarcina sp. NPDC096371 TaxID=3364530 RepID=UPI00381867D0